MNVGALSSFSGQAVPPVLPPDHQGKRVRNSSMTDQDGHQDKKARVLDSHDNFWCLLHLLITQNSGSLGELASFGRIVFKTCGLEEGQPEVSIDILKSSFSIQQIEELQGLTEWALLLVVGRIPSDYFQKNRFSGGGLKKYLNIRSYVDILTSEVAPLKELNPISLTTLCQALQQETSSGEALNSKYAILKRELMVLCSKCLSSEGILNKFLNNLEMQKAVAYSFKGEIEKMNLEMRLRIALLTEAICYSLPVMATHESITSPFNDPNTLVPSELLPMLEQLEHCVLTLRNKHPHKQFLHLMHFHQDAEYTKIVDYFSTVSKINFDHADAHILLQEKFSDVEIKELHHLVEWRYLLLQGRTPGDLHTFDSVKKYLRINCCDDIITVEVEPKAHYNAISLRSLCNMLAENASSKRNQRLGSLFTTLKDYCLDRIQALLNVPEIIRTFTKDLMLEESLVGSFMPFFQTMSPEMTLRTLLLAKIVRFCEFNNLEKELSKASHGDLYSVYVLIEMCYSNKFQGLYSETSKAPSWDYALTSLQTQRRNLLQSLLWQNNEILIAHYRKLDLPGMPNWMPNGGNSCYISSSLWSIFFLLDNEIQTKMNSLASTNEVGLHADQQVARAKTALINLYKEISSTEEKKIQSFEVNSFRNLVHDAFPGSFTAPRGKEQEDAYDFLICLLNLLSLDPFLPGAPEFQRRHTYPSSTDQPLIEAEQYDWTSALSSSYSKDALHATVDIGLGEMVKEHRTLKHLVTLDRRTEDVEKNAYKKNAQHDGPAYRTVAVQHVEQLVVESEQAAPRYFIGRVARFGTDLGGKRRDVIIPNATLEFCIKGRENESVRVPYDLVAITNHKGPTIHSGHYYTYACRFENDQWRFYKYDDLADPSVCENGETVIRDVAVNGYIFYYKKRGEGEGPAPLPFEENPSKIDEATISDAEKWMKFNKVSKLSSGGKAFQSLMELFVTHFPELKDCLTLLDAPQDEKAFMSSCSLVIGRPVYFVNPVKDNELAVVDGHICPSEPNCFGMDIVNQPIVYVFSQSPGKYWLLEK